MKTCCELCGTATNDKMSYLELKTWEIDQLIKEVKEFYSICYKCFDKESEKQIEKDADHDLRKQRALLYKQLEQDGFKCPSCDGKFTVEHVCQSN
ncbi:hypothetical protein [Bacillus sp. MRMR6]|uniref:hypothetical protein n=1 Tax=Bacillus sp. MRMR6 TaxID=1928617 RepID=UPI000951DB0D|nr:hypothetical protein [Bacillus sp. MRMR6]OLS40705.1 hypothetical protein BTR25_07350 [Bacillus sp. MRMR6]